MACDTASELDQVVDALTADLFRSRHNEDVQFLLEERVVSFFAVTREGAAYIADRLVALYNEVAPPGCQRVADG